MHKQAVWLAAVWLALSACAPAEDLIKTGNRKIVGKVTEITATEVTAQVLGTSEKVPVNEIEDLAFEEDPAPLKQARVEAVTGRYHEALAALEKVDLAQVSRAAVKQDVEFYRALCASRLALAGEGAIQTAGAQMRRFLTDNAQSYHYFQACEVVGDLLVALGQFPKAREYYDLVGKAPWPEYQVRAAVAAGESLLAENKADEALKVFERAQAMSLGNPRGELLRLAAVIGQARGLAETGKADEAVKLADGVIAKADAEDTALLARAYNAKGAALEKAGKPQEALFAFLRVDTLYSAESAAHAEALYHLVQIWKDVKKPERSNEARRVLATQYKESRWNRALPP